MEVKDNCETAQDKIEACDPPRNILWDYLVAKREYLEKLLGNFEKDVDKE